MKKVLVLVACAVFLFAGFAKADTLVIGGNYTQPIEMLVDGTAKTEGGGDIWPSYLNGQLLDYLYCVDLFTTVYVPGTYPATVVTSDGTIYDNALNNADQVAFLLNSYAASADTFDEQAALQAAIWNVSAPTGHTAELNPAAPAAQVILYSGYLTGIGSGVVSDYYWITPGLNSNGQVVQYQGLVGHSPVPIPGAIWLLGSGLLGLVAVRRRRK